MPKESSRSVNTIRNSSFGIIEYCFTLVSAFVVRTVFIRYMAEEYLGFNGLFTNIVSMFSLAELGIGNALGFMLYRSLASHDVNKTRQIMAYYRKIYSVIAAVIFAIGIALMPFLTSLIEDVSHIPENIYLLYFLYVADSSVSYIMAYKQALISRDQKEYIISIAITTYTIVTSLSQIIIIILWQNYILYLVAQFAFHTIKNFVLAKVADRMYPFLKQNHEVIDKNDRIQIIKDTKALLLYRISGQVTSSTDNLIISKFLGITMVGLYSNYYMITHACYSLIKKGVSGISASAGNLFSVGEISAIEDLFSAATFFSYWAYGYFSSIFVAVLDLFIRLWAGDNYILDRPIVIIVIINFFLMGITETYGIFRNAFGLFIQGRFRPVAGSITNLIVSLIFVRIWGLFGVFFGTFVSFAAFSYWFDPYVIYKYAIRKSSKKFWIKSSNYLLASLFACFLSYFVSCLFPNTIHELVLFLIRGFTVTALYNWVIYLFYHNTKEYKYIYNKLIRNVFNLVTGIFK